MTNLGYKTDLLKKLQMISEDTSAELLDRIDNLPAKELVALLSSSIQLQSLLETEIETEKRKLEDASDDRIVDIKYSNLGVDRSKVVNLLDNFG